LTEPSPPTTPTPPTPPARSAAASHKRAMRANRIFARMLEGQPYQAIAKAERVTDRRVRQIVQEWLHRWDIDPSEEYVLVQIARLEGALRMIEREIADGKLAAVPHLIKVLDRLDSYHGGGLYTPPLGVSAKDKGVAIKSKMERLAASRTAVATRPPPPALAGKAPGRKEIA
jgi:hypothetical protein